MAEVEEVAGIARGLSEAQRVMLIDLGRGQPREYSLGRAGFALIDKELAFVNELGARHLTDLGHAVRTHLLEEQSRD